VSTIVSFAKSVNKNCFDLFREKCGQLFVLKQMSTIASTCFEKSVHYCFGRPFVVSREKVCTHCFERPCFVLRESVSTHCLEGFERKSINNGFERPSDNQKVS